MRGDKSTWLEENVPPELVSSTLFNFSFVGPNGLNVTLDMSRDLDIDYEKLEYLLQTLPAQYMWWATVHSELKYQIQFCEAKIDRREAMLIKQFRNTAHSNGVKLTDKQLSALVDSDDVDEVAITREVTAQHINDEISVQELQKRINEAVAKERKATLRYLKGQLIIANRNAGKVGYMVQAIQMRADHCRSLAGFKRQEHTQARDT